MVESFSLHAVCTNTVFNYLSESRKSTERIVADTSVSSRVGTRWPLQLQLQRTCLSGGLGHVWRLVVQS